MSNKRINKAYVRYDGSGRVIPGSLILSRLKPKVGNWSETPAYECCNSAPILALRLLFSNISEVNAIIGDSSNVANWNTYFDLPAFGTPFTSVEVVGNEVRLFGFSGSNITIKDSLFDQPDELGTYLLEVDDTAGCIIEVEYGGFGCDSYQGCRNVSYMNLPALIIGGDYAFSCLGDFSPTLTLNLPLITTAGNKCFYGCNSLTSVSLPQLQTAGNGCFLSCYSLTSVSFPQLQTTDDYCFQGCTLLTTVNLPLLTNINGNACFDYCTSLTTINIPSCTNLGATVDNDAVFLNISGNTITLTVPSALMTANAGSPDGDIVHLQTNNTVTVITV